MIKPKSLVSRSQKLKKSHFVSTVWLIIYSTLQLGYLFSLKYIYRYFLLLVFSSWNSNIYFMKEDHFCQNWSKAFTITQLFYCIYFNMRKCYWMMFDEFLYGSFRITISIRSADRMSMNLFCKISHWYVMPLVCSFVCLCVCERCTVRIQAPLEFQFNFSNDRFMVSMNNTWYAFCVPI